MSITQVLIKIGGIVLFIAGIILVLSGAGLLHYLLVNWWITILVGIGILLLGLAVLTGKLVRL